MRIVALADTHGAHLQVAVPDGDVLVHAGDITAHGTLQNVNDFNDWLAAHPHRHKIVIAGNHDWCFERRPKEAQERLTGCTYLQDSSTIIDGVHFYGSPWQPAFCDWAFNLYTPQKLRSVWAKIPDLTDVLITHGPPFGILDRCRDGRRVGCKELLDRVKQVQPLHHIFGHIHEAYGSEHGGDEGMDTQFSNVSVYPYWHDPHCRPVVLDL